MSWIKLTARQLIGDYRFGDSIIMKINCDDTMKTWR